MQQITVYLEKPIGPGGKDWVQGFLVAHTALGVTMCTNVNGDGRTFWPTHQIQKVEYR